MIGNDEETFTTIEKKLDVVMLSSKILVENVEEQVISTNTNWELVKL